MPATDIPLEDLYRTSTLLEGFVQLPPAAVFLRDRLFSVVQETEADLVSIEFYRGKQKLAPFCSRYSKGIAVAREKEQLSLFSPPFVKANRMLHADDLLRRNIGGTRANGNASNRDADLLVIDEQELDAAISRTENWMCSQVLFTGKLLCLDGDTSKPVAEIDYGPISRTVTAKPWSDQTSKPLDDLKAAQRLVSGACGFTANLIVMGKDAGDAFEANPNVMEAYNKLQISQGALTPEFEQFGIVLLGNWRGIPLYVSEEQYEAADGIMKYFVPPKVDDRLLAAKIWPPFANSNDDSIYLKPGANEPDTVFIIYNDGYGNTEILAPTIAAFSERLLRGLWCKSDRYPGPWFNGQWSPAPDTRGIHQETLCGRQTEDEARERARPCVMFKSWRRPSKRIEPFSDRWTGFARSSCSSARSARSRGRGSNCGARRSGFSRTRLNFTRSFTRAASAGYGSSFASKEAIHDDDARTQRGDSFSNRRSDARRHARYAGAGTWDCAFRARQR